MAKDGISIIIQSLREETRETLEKSLFPLNRSEFICDLCGFENEVDEEKKIVVECQGCHETILGGLPNNGDHRKSFRCECNLLVSAKTFPGDETMRKRYFLGDCPKCHRVLLIDPPDIEDTRYCICPSCQKCLYYENTKKCCGVSWPISTICIGCHANISLPQRENDSKFEIREIQFFIVLFFSYSILFLLGFYDDFDFIFFTPKFLFICSLFLGFGGLLVIYYPKWRWGTVQEIRFESEHLPETLDILSELSRTEKDLTLNIKKSRHCDSLLTEDEIEVLKK